MSIQGNISPRIIQNISGLYTDSNRVLLEFVDNSIDNAEQYFDTLNNKYSRPIKIILDILGDNHKNGHIVITDNCEGIVDLKKIVEDFGNSRKRGQAETNGEFGFGMCSFLACCEKLEITTRTKKDLIEKIVIAKEHFNVDKHEDFKFSNIEKIKDFLFDSGTIIKLATFNKSSWKDLNIDFIKNEIEKHFELLLNRGNLEIKLRNKNKEHICKPFDYSIHKGQAIDELIYEISSLNQKLEKPIHLFIKIIKGKDLNKRPVFIIKGRRINEVKEIKEFKSDFKSDIWNHPNITGFIDLIDFIKPNISRLGFRPESKEETRAIFDILISKENEILNLIRDSNEETQEKHYQQLEDILSKALSKIARIDAMNFRTEYFAGNDIKLQEGAIGVGDSIFPPLSSDPNNPNFGIKNDDIKGDNPNDELGGNKNLNKEIDNPFDDKEPQGSERKKSGFNIKISDLEPNIDSDTGKQIKSRLLGNTIEIFRKHPEFEKRVGHFAGGAPKISQRLITYLAGEITVHYKDKFYMKSGQPTYDKKMFANLVDSIYLFEDLLKDAVGKDLSSWNN